MPIQFKIAGKTIHLYTQGEYKEIHRKINELQLDVENLKKDIKKLEKSKAR